MRNLVGCILLVAAPLCAAATHCEPVPSKGEGHWPMPEEYFTKENALLATDRLVKLVKDVDQFDDEFCIFRNHAVVIEGYVLKRELERIEQPGLKAEYVKNFCRFLIEKAYTCH